MRLKARVLGDRGSAVVATTWPVACLSTQPCTIHTHCRSFPLPNQGQIPSTTRLVSLLRRDVELRLAALTFQTGNVFYEVLFTVINPDEPLINFMYLGFSVLTLVLGSLALVLGSSILFWISDFEERSNAISFASHMTPCINSLGRLYFSSLITWLLAMTVSSSVKYPEHWYFSFSTASFSLVVCICAALYVCYLNHLLPQAVRPQGDPYFFWKEAMGQWLDFARPFVSHVRVLTGRSSEGLYEN